jgi:hypothetical protein
MYDRYHFGLMPVRSAAAVAGFAVVSAVAAYFGYLWMFSGFTSYDDEGFMLIALRGFISGHSLYDKVVVQYGPAYFEFFGLFGALGVPFDHDSGRYATLIMWLAIALVAGVAVFVFTRNLALGLATHLLTFGTAITLKIEPMHPGALVCLLVIGIGAVALISSGRSTGPLPLLVIGALTAAAILTKVNVGVFAAVSVAFACVLAYPTLARNWPIRLLVTASFISLPFLLMMSDLDQAWARRLAFHVFFCAFALVLATITSQPDPNRRRSELGWLLGGGALLGLVVLAAASLEGSSARDLANGIILYPLQQRAAFAAPFSVPTIPMLWDAVGLGGALLWARYRMRTQRPAVAVEGGVRILAGLLIWLSLLAGLGLPGLAGLNLPGFAAIRLFTDPLVLPVALAWVVAAPRARPEGGFEKLDFARALVPALAILQTLHVFPVAGSQTGWAALPLVTVGAVCISDGMVQVRLSQVRVQLATWLVFLALVVSWVPAAWRDTQAQCAATVPLGLPGASLVRVPPDEVTLLKQITQTIRDNCDTYVSVPGLDSFYLFGQLQPPTPLPSRYMWLSDDVRHEQALVASVDRIKRLCVVENDYLIYAWTEGRTLTGPLDAYIQAGFVPIYEVHHYSILVRRP